MRLSAHLDALARTAIRAALRVDVDPMIRPTADAKHGDYQLNGVLPLAKREKKNPRELALPLCAALSSDPTFERVEVAGPGFVNLTLSPTFVATTLDRAAHDRARDGVPAVDVSETIVVDFSGPNIAKQMHVGHLRSTILGAAIVALLREVGHRVIGDNHLGDWGTQFGLLIVGMRRFGDERALSLNPISELERVYKLATTAAKTGHAESGSSPAAILEEAREELAKLQRGDPENRALWERFVAATRRELDVIYARLGVTFDAWLGESTYDAMLPGIVDDLLAKGIAVVDDGAVCVWVEGIATPFIVRKKDGAFLYSTTDVATILHRRDHFHADRGVYVVDVRQALHFEQLFAVAAKLGVTMKLAHVGFGTILGTDGKPLKTRDGNVITLASLLDEAESRAAARIREEGLDVPESELAEVARAVGVGAVKYADLRQNRLSDYQFDWDKMISFKGNAGPTLQYAHARVQSLLRKGDVDPTRDGGPIVLAAPEELALGKQLLAFADAVHAAAESYEPHRIADHAYAVARLFSAFYEACPVLKAEGTTRASRVAMTDLTGRQLARSLRLLGVTPIPRM